MMRGPALALGAALLLSGCAIGGLERAAKMSPEEIAAQSDGYVCDRLSGFAYSGRIPPAWVDEADRRSMQHCVARGIRKRREVRETDTRDLFCDPTSNVQTCR